MNEQRSCEKNIDWICLEDYFITKKLMKPNKFFQKKGMEFLMVTGILGLKTRAFTFIRWYRFCCLRAETLQLLGSTIQKTICEQISF